MSKNAKKHGFGTKSVGIARNQEILMPIDAPRSGNLENRGFRKTFSQLQRKIMVFLFLGGFARITMVSDNHGFRCFRVGKARCLAGLSSWARLARSDPRGPSTVQKWRWMSFLRLASGSTGQLANPPAKTRFWTVDSPAKWFFRLFGRWPTGQIYFHRPILNQSEKEPSSTPEPSQSTGQIQIHRPNQSTGQIGQYTASFGRWRASGRPVRPARPGPAGPAGPS